MEMSGIPLNNVQSVLIIYKYLTVSSTNFSREALRSFRKPHVAPQVNIIVLTESLA
jgi:hypothetical protein